MTVILDACAVIAFLRDEEGADAVEAALIGEECFIHAINMCEVYKDCLSRGENRTEADRLLESLYSTGLAVREDMDESLWKEAAGFKASIRRISYADCLALSITNRLGGILYTSDRHELEPVAEDGICQYCHLPHRPYSLREQVLLHIPGYPNLFHPVTCGNRETVCDRLHNDDRKRAGKGAEYMDCPNP